MTKTRKHAPKQTAETKGWFSSQSPLVQDLLCIGALYAVTLILFRGVVFDGAVLGTEGDAANHLSNVHPLTVIENTEGVAPLWSPFIFSGMPTSGSLMYVSPWTNPVNYLCVSLLQLLFLNGALSWLVVHYFLGGVFMFFLMRAWNFSRVASLLAAFTFMLSPFAISLAEAGHGSKLRSLSYLPLVVLLTHVLLEKRSLLTFGLLSAALGTLLLTNHVQIVYYALIVVGLYAAYYIAMSFRDRPATKLSMMAGAILLGLGIAAIVYLPVYEYSHFSIRGGGTEGTPGGLTWEYATNWSTHPAELITLLIPSFFGFQSPYYWGSMPFTSSTFYAGIVPIVLSVIALSLKRNRTAVFLLGLTVLVLLMSFGKHFAPLYDLFFQYLPFFNKFRAPSTILHLLPFTLGALATIGLAALWETDPQSDRGRKLARVLMIVLGMLGGFLLLGFLLKSSLFSMLSSSSLVKEGEVELYTRQYGARATQIVDQLKQIRFYGNEDMPGLWGDFLRFSFLGLASVGIVFARLRGYLSRGWMAGLLMVLLLVDLLQMDAKFIRPVPSRSVEDRFRPDQTIAFLKQQEEPFRVFPVGEYFMDNTYAYNGIETIGGYSPAKLKIYQTMLDSCMYRGVDPLLPLNMNIVNMLNVRYLVASGQLPGDRFQLVSADQARRKYTFLNSGALPRAFFVKNVRVAASDSEVFSILNAQDFDAATTAVVGEPLPLAVGVPDSASAEIVEWKSRSIRVKTYASDPAFLVLSEVYYPAGWEATIDGTPAEIHRTNYVLRGVVVPEGSHEVVLTFEPETISLGRTISIGAWLITGICIIIGLWNTPAVKDRLRRTGRAPHHDDEGTKG
jgi:hypothetical protein